MRIILASFALALIPAAARAGNPTPKQVETLQAKAVAFLKSAQGPDGSFSPKLAGPGVTALVAAALLHSGLGPDDPTVAKALTYLEKSVREDGGLANYTTSVAIMAFKEANAKGQYDDVIKNAAAFLKKNQHAGEESLTQGGFGYDGKSRPDMSNTAFSVEALLAAGVPKDDPAIKNALKFISRCQNLPGEFNDQPFAQKTTDEDKGGFVYNPTESDSKRDLTASGGLRSLGGMTYGGLKSFLYAGVGKDDPRVKACIDWLRRHYTLDENPGMGKAGLFYYYHTFAKALDAYGEEPFFDAGGKKHAWRTELFSALKNRQRDDGSWINEGDRAFAEFDPNLSTAFALLSLKYCREK